MYSQKAVLWYCKYLWNYNTDRQEISRQYLHNENVSSDAVLWRHNKFKIADGRPPFWRPLNHHISVKNHPILIKFGTLQPILNLMTVTWPKTEFFKIQDGGGRHLENRVFGHNWSTDCPISAKVCTRKQNGMLTRAMGQKMQMCKIQDGGRPQFWKSLNRHISVKNRPILMTFGTLHQILNPVTVTWRKIEIFKIQNGGGRHLKIAFLAIDRLSDFSEISYEEAELQVDKSYVTKTANF